jgi:hypothetical protein
VSCGAALAAPQPIVPPPPRRAGSKKRILVVAVVLFVAVLIVAVAAAAMSNNNPSGGQANDGASNSPSTTPAGTNDTTSNGGATPSNSPAPEQIANVTLSGSGDTVTDKFELKSGIAEFHMTYNGPSNFAVTLYSSAGEYVDLLANEIGSYSGSSLVGVSGESVGTSAGQHYLEVSASGPWTVVVEQPRVSSASSIPVTLSGKGADVPAPFTLPSGSVKFTMTHEGSSNFAVTLYDANGDYVDLLANEIGSYSGSKSVSVDGSLFGASPGIHYLKVDADGSWVIQISKI